MSNSKSTKAVLDILGYLLGVIVNVAFYAAVVYALVFVAKNAYEFSYQIFGDRVVEQAPGRDIRITIEKGESTMAIANKLYMNKLVVNKYTFYLKTRLFDKKIMQGTFDLNSSMTYGEILDTITNLENAVPEEELP